MANGNTKAEAYENFREEVRRCENEISNLNASMLNASRLMSLAASEGDKLSIRAQGLIKDLTNANDSIIARLLKLESEVSAQIEKIYTLSRSIDEDGPSMSI